MSCEAMKTNYHTHSTWCDGANHPEDVIRVAIEKGFDELGFSSHMAFPVDDGCAMTPEDGPGYVAEIRALAANYADRIRVLCGGEADYIRGQTAPDRTRYAHLGLDYLIGSVHYIVAPDSSVVPVDHAPDLLRAGIEAHFGGSAEAFVKSYFEQEREMVATCDFDVVGHPDLVRKFNAKHPYFDETAAWYRDELEQTAEVIGSSGKLVEVNTGAISRGWLDDVYPSAPFRDLLRARGVKFILSSDAHAAATLDAAFDRFGAAEDYVRPAFAERGARR